MTAWRADGGPKPGRSNWSPPSASTTARCWTSVRTPKCASGHLPRRGPRRARRPARPGIQARPPRQVVMRGHGERAMTAASLLRRAEHAAAVLAGGRPRTGRTPPGRPLHEGPWPAAALGLRTSGEPDVRLGLRVNLPQFLVLAVVNFFVGGMVGLERTVTPLVGSEQFHLGEIAIASFVVDSGSPRRSPTRPRRRDHRALHTQVHPGRGLAHRPAGAVHARLGTQLGLGDRRQRPARRQPGPDLVDDGQHEDRPGRARPARTGSGHQRDRPATSASLSPRWPPATWPPGSGCPGPGTPLGAGLRRRPGSPCPCSRSATPPPGPAPKPASTPSRPGRIALGCAR